MTLPNLGPERSKVNSCAGARSSRRQTLIFLY